MTSTCPSTFTCLHILYLALFALPFPLSLALPMAMTEMATSALPKMVFAHFIVGNTRPYTISDWTQDITLASSKGIDAFALNVGADGYEPSQVANAYQAAAATGASFKLFLSFDMTSLPCSAPDHADLLRQYITNYQAHPNQLLYGGKVFISTFGGEYCTFGQNGLNVGWEYAVKSPGVPPVYFVPSFFTDPSMFSGLSVLDGAFNWDSAWPSGDYDINFASDENYISHLGGRTYMAAFSPWFFTHYPPNTYNKNFIYRTDDWHFSARWELLIQNREQVGLVEAVTWNDYGESHYMGPRHGDMSMSQAWTDGYDHQPWLDLLQYYIQAYKTGANPSVQKDKVYLWARLQPAAAVAPDYVGKPTHWEWTQDYLWAVIFLTSPAEVTLTCGTSTQSMNFDEAGVQKMKLPLKEDCSARADISRLGLNSLSFQPEGFNFKTRPQAYNFNAFVAAST